MRQLGVVFEREFKETVRSRSYLFIWLIIISFFIGLTGFITIRQYENNEPLAAPVIALACEDGALAERLENDLPYYEFIKLDGAVDPESFFSQNVCDAVLLIKNDYYFVLYQQTSMFGGSDLYDTIYTSLSDLKRVDELSGLGISEAEARNVLGMYASGRLVRTGGLEQGKFILICLLIFVMFFSIDIYGQMIATGVSKEKGSRTMEVLASSASHKSLLCGKVLGIGCACMIQISLFFAASAVLLSLFSKNVMHIGPVMPEPSALVLIAAYYVLGFVLTAFIYGAIGSFVSGTQELPGLATIPVYILGSGYFVAVSALSRGACTPMLRFASHFPLWSPVAMPARMALEKVSFAELTLSLLLLCLADLAAAHYCSRLYRRWMLMYGKRPSVRSLIKRIFAK